MNDERVAGFIVHRSSLLVHSRRVPIDEAAFRQAMSHFASGVTIVTTEHGGRPFGMTVASFASLSLRPPLVLVCIEKSVKTHDAIAAARKFGVSILGADQADISSRFASKSEDKFTGVELAESELDVPLIAGALTTLECSVRDQLPGGDHSIFVGEVERAITREGDPLLYFRSGYREMQR
jgi:flavin reductase (DIM6/NTAB) family NADH-FMN oxidoreductase RutF